MHTAAGVTADHPPIVRPGRLRRPRLLIKQALARGIRWYVERLAVDVRRFAAASTEVAAAAQREIDLVRSQTAELGRSIQAVTSLLETNQEDVARALSGLRDRLARCEREMHRAPIADQPAVRKNLLTATTQGATDQVPGSAFDYFAFETLMRGSREEIAERQRRYLPLFANRERVVDVGCGRGEFLGLLREAGVMARGVDMDADMVAQCRAEGLDVEQSDAVHYLEMVDPGSLDGIFAAQVVEHLPPRKLVQFLSAARTALAAGGLIVLETINPASLSALRNYFADLTHVQPLVAETLAFLVETAGFKDPRIEFTSALPESGQLRQIPFGDTVPPEAAVASQRNIDLLNALLFAPQDYAVIAGG